MPMAAVEGAAHILTYANPAFYSLINKAEGDIIGKPFREILIERTGCLALLNRVRLSGKSESFMEPTAVGPVFFYAVWPTIADGPALGIVIQMIESPSLNKNMLAMNEALVVGSLRQIELTAVATLSNTRLQTEAEDHKQRELDARMLANEIAHRIKNNLHIVGSLIGREARRAAAPCVQGYEAMQARIEAIAELYDLISKSSQGQAVALDAYLAEIARAMSASLLSTVSGITIEVRAEALDIDPNRAVPFGLLVNELATNAIKHAFVDGTGSVVLGVRRIGDQIELDVADDGIGLQDRDLAKASETHGSDYVAIFVRQLGGSLVVSESEGSGTTVTVRFPLLLGL